MELPFNVCVLLGATLSKYNEVSNNQHAQHVSQCNNRACELKLCVAYKMVRSHYMVCKDRMCIACSIVRARIMIKNEREFRDVYPGIQRAINLIVDNQQMSADFMRKAVGNLGEAREILEKINQVMCELEDLCSAVNYQWEKEKGDYC